MFLQNVGTYLPDIQPHTAILLGLNLISVRTSNLVRNIIKIIETERSLSLRVKVTLLSVLFLQYLRPTNWLHNLLT